MSNLLVLEVSCEIEWSLSVLLQRCRCEKISQFIMLSGQRTWPQRPAIEGRFNPNDFSITDLMPFSNQRDGLGLSRGLQFKETRPLSLPSAMIVFTSRRKVTLSNPVKAAIEASAFG